MEVELLYNNAEDQLNDLAQAATAERPSVPEAKRLAIRVTSRATVEVNDVEVPDSHLTKKEIDLLYAIGNRDSVVTKEQLLNELYAGMDEPELKIIDVFTCKLRKKLGEHGALAIETVWGRGYRMGTGYKVVPPRGRSGVHVDNSVRQLLDAVAAESDPPRKPDELASELLLKSLQVLRAKIWS